MGDSVLSAVAAAHLCETTAIGGARSERQMTPLRVSHLRSVIRTDSLCVPLLLLVLITLQIKLLHHLFVGSFCFGFSFDWFPVYIVPMEQMKDYVPCVLFALRQKVKGEHQTIKVANARKK